MAFEKGHKVKGGGRPKGTKTSEKQKLIQYKPKYWQKSMHSTYDIEEVTFRLENNLPLDDLIDKLNNKYGKRKTKNDDKNM